MEQPTSTKNEFELTEEDMDSLPTTTTPKSTGQPEFDNNAGGTVYDYNSAPDTAKAPPRVDMQGKVVTINKADILTPPTSSPWQKSRKGDKELKTCRFIMFYDFEGQQESYSGVRVFNRDGVYSHPTITKDRKNQASELMGAYADYKQKNINEVSLKEFMSFLNSKPKALIKTVEVQNPLTLQKVRKNLVDKFV